MSEPTVDRPVVAVLDYGIGNLRSAEKALERVGAHARLTSDAGLVREAAAVVMPGVGAFGRCMEALRDHGLDRVAVEVIEAGTPFFGICVGMQMLYEASDEAPGVPGLGVLPGTLHLLPGAVRRPQMQWNRLDIVRPSEMFTSLPAEAWVYFVHSYCAPIHDGVVATCDYGSDVVAAVDRGNVWATQFHPEKSGANGLAILAVFARRAGALVGAG